MATKCKWCEGKGIREYQNDKGRWEMGSCNFCRGEGYVSGISEEIRPGYVTPIHAQIEIEDLKQQIEDITKSCDDLIDEKDAQIRRLENALQPFAAVGHHLPPPEFYNPEQNIMTIINYIPLAVIPKIWDFINAEGVLLAVEEDEDDN